MWTPIEDGKWKPTLVLLRIIRAATCVKWSPKGKSNQTIQFEPSFVSISLVVMVPSKWIDLNQFKVIALFT